MLSSAYISLIESGDRQPSAEAIAHIANVLEVDLNELVTGKPPGLEVELELAIVEAKRKLDQGNSAEATAVLEQSLAAARKHALVRSEARALEGLARIAEREGAVDRALKLYTQAEELWRGEPLHLRCEAVAGAARCTQRLGDARMAIYLLDSYRLELTGSKEPDPPALMRICTALIHPYFAAGLPEKAVESAREALQLENRVDDPDQLSCMHLIVARSLLYQGHYADALESVRKAEQISLAGGWRNRVVKAQIAEAIVLAKKTAFEDARDKLTSALEILVESPNQLDEALALNEMGHVVRHLGDLDAARGYLERARPLLKESHVIERAFNERELGLCLVATDPDLAERHLKRAIDDYRISGASGELATTFKALGDLYVSQGRHDLAIEALRQGLEAVEERTA